jgi:uncharacterized protein (UPF0333 family)
MLKRTLFVILFIPAVVIAAVIHVFLPVIFWIKDGGSFIAAITKSENFFLNLKDKLL